MSNRLPTQWEIFAPTKTFNSKQQPAKSFSCQQEKAEEKEDPNLEWLYLKFEPKAATYVPLTKTENKETTPSPIRFHATLFLGLLKISSV